jgi:hypothetical protein
VRRSPRTGLAGSVMGSCSRTTRARQSIARENDSGGQGISFTACWPPSPRHRVV